MSELTGAGLLKWDRRWLGLARHYASWSIDPSTAVGCVIARGKVEVSQGYNGFPTGIADTDERLQDREQRLALTLHAEHNAILRVGAALVRGASLYVWPFPPCHRCACDIVQAGIGRVVVPLVEDEEPVMYQRRLRWKESLELARGLFREAGIPLIGLSLDQETER